MSATVSDRVRIYGSNLHFCIEVKGTPDSKGYAPTEHNPTGYLPPEGYPVEHNPTECSTQSPTAVDWQGRNCHYRASDNWPPDCYCRPA